MCKASCVWISGVAALLIIAGCSTEDDAVAPSLPDVSGKTDDIVAGDLESIIRFHGYACSSVKEWWRLGLLAFKVECVEGPYYLYETEDYEVIVAEEPPAGDFEQGGPRDAIAGDLQRIIQFDGYACSRVKGWWHLGFLAFKVGCAEGLYYVYETEDFETVVVEEPPPGGTEQGRLGDLIGRNLKNIIELEGHPCSTVNDWTMIGPSKFDVECAEASYYVYQSAYEVTVQPQ